MFIYRHRRPTKLNCLSSLLSTLLLRKWLRAVFQIKVVHQPFYISICISGLSMQHTTGVNNAQMFMMVNPEYCIQRRIRPPPPCSDSYKFYAMAIKGIVTFASSTLFTGSFKFTPTLYQINGLPPKCSKYCTFESFQF